jgi:hypothetical protein
LNDELTPILGLARPRPTLRCDYVLPPLVFKHLEPRTRCLTPPPEGGSVVLPCSSTDDQAQSLLFMLPNAVRFNIYRKVIGGKLLHIVRRSKQLGHVSCRTCEGQEWDSWMLKCRGAMKLHTGFYAHIGRGSSGLIQLLQSCRAVYVDAIRLLYETNTFDFDCMEGFIQ